MKLTEEELIDTWRYFQFCCLPSIIMAKYAYMDYIEDIKQEKIFYRHKQKKEINRIGKLLDTLPNRLMAVSSQNIRYMNILGDNIDEQFEDEKEELHRAIYISFKNGKMEHLDCLAALHYISAMLQLATISFYQCCKDYIKTRNIDPTSAFHLYNLKEITEDWDKILDAATSIFGYDKKSKKVELVNLNNPRCTKALITIRKKLTSVTTLRNAMKNSYPWSINYKEGVPYEKSIDYYMVTTTKQ